MDLSDPTTLPACPPDTSEDSGEPPVKRAKLVDNGADTVDEQEIQHLMAIVEKLMFVHGDTEEPREECQRYLLRIVFLEMNEMIYVAKRNMTKRRRQQKPTIEAVDLVFQFRRHPLLLRRLIEYIRFKEGCGSADKVVKAGTSEAKPGKEALAESDFEKEKKGVKELRRAVRKFDVHRRLEPCFARGEVDPPIFDDANGVRKCRMWKHGETMSKETYEQFAEARKYSFVTIPKRRTSTLVRKYLKWLGARKVSRLAVWILNFCSVELVASLTEMAAVNRRMEFSKLKDSYPFEGLQLRHYEQAYRRLPRRSAQFRGCSLFAFF